MKKQYICPKSEVIYIECGSPLLNTSEPDCKVLIDGDDDTETDDNGKKDKRCTQLTTLRQ